MPKIDLLPCPFCGRKPKSIVNIQMFAIGCSFSKCHVYPCVVKKTPEEAAKAWNTRAFGWIPCSARMPEDDVDVLVYDDGILIARYNADEKYTSGWMESFECYPLTNVTHWMPLPSMPEVTNNVD